MHNVSELYKVLLANPLHRKELRIDIAGVEYREGNIVSCSTSGGVFAVPGIGNCAARQLDMKILPVGAIPRQAEIKIYIRLGLNGDVSEWIPKGVFYISRRNLDKQTGVLSITAFDAMLKTEQLWLTADYADASWPMSQINAARDIASRIGVELDERTQLSTAFPVEYPIDEYGDLTMREVLGYIAVSNAGNWIITDEGKLRLLGFGDIPEETEYLVESNGDAILFGGVRILV